MSEIQQVTLADIEAAAEVIEGVAIRTPMAGARWLSDRADGPVRFKCENLQRTGSFKMRGGYVRLSRLSEAQRERGVVAASAGNHAQGVALSAQLLGIPATVFMPEGAPIPKVNATKGYGAEVVFHGQYLDDSIIRAKEFAAETGAEFIHPYDHPDIVAGQGTCGLEIIEQAPDVETVLVPVGGGGVLAGIALAIKAKNPRVHLVGVQAAGAAAYPESLAQGHPVRLRTMQTMADGIAVGLPGDLPFAAIRDHVDEVVTVDEDAISRAVLAVAERAKLIVEPAGAVAVAALMNDPAAYPTPTVAVLSGGNIDPLLLGKVIRQGMVAADRYLYLEVCIPDLPGGLAGLLNELATSGANVLEVVHERISPRLHLQEVEVHIQVETRGPEHAQRVREHLAETGYRLSS
ncbi:MAG: threonine ammonia-lyase [Nocardioides sp.]